MLHNHCFSKEKADDQPQGVSDGQDRPKESQDSQEYTHLADLYGLTCTRLMRLLKLDLGKGDVLEKGFDEMLKISVEAICEEDAQGIRYDDDKPEESSEWAKANFEAIVKAGDDSPLMDQWLAESSQYWEDL